jgi:hypothetical protein
MTKHIKKHNVSQEDNFAKVPPELDKIVDVVLAYRPKQKEKDKPKYRFKKLKKEDK